MSTLIISPGEEGYLESGPGPVYLPTGWKEFRDENEKLVRYRSTSSSGTLLASYHPQINEATCYLCEVFIPGTNATTRRAKYTVSHMVDQGPEKTEVIINQNIFYDTWVKLGVYHLDPNDPNSGLITLEDKTDDSYPRSIAFSSIRYQPVFGIEAPVGEDFERAEGKIWPGNWIDANPYLKYYAHPGADLNLNIPDHNLDEHAPVYSIADGVVTFAGPTQSQSWQSLIVISHGNMVDGTPIYSRYGHVEEINVVVGQQVNRGQLIAKIGKSGGQGGNYHLHFDISYTHVLRNYPEHWPNHKNDVKTVLDNYLDPKEFLMNHLVCEHDNS